VELLRDPDAKLIADCRNPDSEGFEAAFEVLFKRYHERIYAIAFRVAGNQADAMDIVQESFALLFKKLGSFRGKSLFSTWLFRIVVNCSIDHRRRNRGINVPIQIEDPAAADQMSDESIGPPDSAVIHEVGDQVQLAISYLSPKLRAVLALRYLEEMSYEELAVTLEVSLGTVKSRIARAHLALEHIVRSRFPDLDITRKLDAEDEASNAASDSLGGVG
jgi:RNA polymerase sigma-70 factor (ECF subfamily)